MNVDWRALARHGTEYCEVQPYPRTQGRTAMNQMWTGNAHTLGWEQYAGLQGASCIEADYEGSEGAGLRVLGSEGSLPMGKPEVASNG